MEGWRGCRLVWGEGETRVASLQSALALDTNSLTAAGTSGERPSQTENPSRTMPSVLLMNGGREASGAMYQFCRYKLYFNRNSDMGLFDDVDGEEDDSALFSAPKCA